MSAWEMTYSEGYGGLVNKISHPPMEKEGYQAGRESIREEAVKVCAEYGALPNLLRAVRSIK